MVGAAASGLQVQNLAAEPSAGGRVELFRQGIGVPVAVEMPSIGPLAAFNLYLPAEPRLGSGAFAALISTDRPVAAVARTEWARSGAAVMASDTDPAVQAVVPLVMCRFVGQTAYLSIQNSDPAQPIPVDVSLYPFGTTEPAVSRRFEVVRGALEIVDPCAPIFDGRFEGRVGYAKVESPTPVAVQVLVNTETSPAAHGFAGVSAELVDEVLYAPLVRNDFHGTTGIAVVNFARGPSQSAEVTLHVTGTLGSCAGQTYRQGPVTIAAGSSAVFYQRGAGLGVPGVSPLPPGCAGAGTVRARGGWVAAVVADAGGNPAAPSTLAAYNAVTSHEVARQVVLPLVRKEHQGAKLSTGIQVMNAGRATAHVEITFTLSSGVVVAGAPCGAGCSARIAPGAVATFYPPSIPALPAGTYGAASIHSDEPLAVIAFEAPARGGVDAAAYNGLRLDPLPGPEPHAPGAHFELGRR
jgi:hypothetical protein